VKNIRWRLRDRNLDRPCYIWAPVIRNASAGDRGDRFIVLDDDGNRLFSLDYHEAIPLRNMTGRWLILTTVGTARRVGYEYAVLGDPIFTERVDQAGLCSSWQYHQRSKRIENAKRFT
jgi:hypothetical protein